MPGGGREDEPKAQEEDEKEKRLVRHARSDSARAFVVVGLVRVNSMYCMFRRAGPWSRPCAILMERPLRVRPRRNLIYYMGVGVANGCCLLSLLLLAEAEFGEGLAEHLGPDLGDIAEHLVGGAHRRRRETEDLVELDLALHLGEAALA